jgi:formylglycine-generating enzyme required for sulfatase activity
LVFAIAGLAQAPPGTQKPLGKNQIMDLVKAGMDNEELAKRAQERGIDFELSDDYLQALRRVGAQDVLIKALRAIKPKPMSEEQVLQLVAGGVPSQRAATLVKQRGIDFMPEEEYLETLRVAGAEEVLVAALRTAGEAATAEMVVVTSPNAEVYLDGELKGRANAQGRLAMKAKLGVHTLKVSLARKKDFEQSVTLAGWQGAMIEARLEDAGPPPGTVRENPKDGLKYVWIPPGTFMMGCSPGDTECTNYEKPSHRVTLTKGFWMGQTEVTVGAYKRFARQAGRSMPPEPNLNPNPVKPGWRDDAIPVVQVTWDEARAYCSWAGGRLPTEAEWEYAARGGSTEARYGDSEEIAWWGKNSGLQVHEVAQKRANAFGLFDVLGNAWEWVNDWYDGSYFQSSPPQDPSGPAGGEKRVVRGYDCCGYNWVNLRISLRTSMDPDFRGNYLNGVRCVWEGANP